MLYQDVIAFGSTEIFFAERPEVKLTKVEVMETKIQVQWKYESKLRPKRDVNDGYPVEVQIKCKKDSDKEYLIYPEDGSKIPARSR